MATEKKYLDLQGLQHLKEQKVLVKHPDYSDGQPKALATPAAVKVGYEANGHVVLGGAISPSDIGAAASGDVKNSTIKITINGVEKDFSLNQPNDEELKWSLSDLGLSTAMHFVGTSLTELEDGSTIASIYIKRHNTDNEGSEHIVENGDVVLYNNKEFVFSKLANAWYELGDQGSHALNTVTISGDGTYITGGGNLQANRTLSHKSYSAATAAAVKIGRDAGGHVVIGGALGTANAGAHTHSVSSTIPANSFLTSASGTTTKISLNKGTDTFIKSYPGVTSKLVTTTITGTNGTVTASKATAGTAVAVAKAGTAVVYGKANVGTAQTVATKASSATTVGNANVGTEISILGIDGSTTASKAVAGTAKNVATTDTAVTVATRAASQTTVGNANVGSEVKATAYNSATPAYTASYNGTNECLTLTALGSISFTPATSSSTKIYGCGENTSITPAKANGTITPYTFTDVTVPVAAEAATAFTPAAASSTTIYGCGGTINITPAVAAPNTQTITPAVSNGTITPYTFTDVTAAKVASAATTVATGALATDASGATIMTGLGTANTGSAINSATIQSGTTGDVTVVSSVSSAKNSAAVTISGTAAENGAHSHEVQ